MSHININRAAGSGAFWEICHTPLFAHYLKEGHTLSSAPSSKRGTTLFGSRAEGVVMDPPPHPSHRGKLLNQTQPQHITKL